MKYHKDGPLAGRFLMILQVTKRIANVRFTKMWMNRKEHGSSTFFFALFLFHIDQDNISTDLYDTPPWNEKFKISSEKPAQPTGTGDDQSKDTAGTAVDFQVTDTAHGTAGAHVDDFLLAQGTQSDGMWIQIRTAAWTAAFFFTHKDLLRILSIIYDRRGRGAFPD